MKTLTLILKGWMTMYLGLDFDWTFLRLDMERLLWILRQTSIAILSAFHPLTGFRLWSASLLLRVPFIGLWQTVNCACCDLCPIMAFNWRHHDTFSSMLESWHDVVYLEQPRYLCLLVYARHKFLLSTFWCSKKSVSLSSIVFLAVQTCTVAKVCATTKYNIFPFLETSLNILQSAFRVNCLEWSDFWPFGSKAAMIGQNNEWFSLCSISIFFTSQVSFDFNNCNTPH